MKKILTVLLSVCASFSALSLGSCDSIAVPDFDKETEKGYVLLNDFESSDEFDLLRLFGVLGKVEKNADAQYVTSGKASAKITLDSTPYKKRLPYMEQAFELVKRGEDYRNFDEITAISFDVYNASQTTLSMGLQLTYGDSNGAQREYLLAQGWTTVSFSVKREYIPRTTDKNGVEAAWVENMRISFDRPQADSELYMDNVRIYKAQKPQSEIRRSLLENEICSFDRDWQTGLIVPSAEKAALLPSFSASFDVTSTGKGASLYIKTTPSEFQGDTYPGVELREDILTGIDWGSYPEDAKLCFDVYAPEENGVDIVWLSAYTDTMRYYVSDEIAIIPGKWQTFSVLVADMNAQLKHKDYNFGKTTSLVFRWAENTGSSRIVYFDNVRMEV